MFFPLEQHPPEHPALVEPYGAVLTYSQLAAAVNCVAQWPVRRTLIFCLTSSTIGFTAGYVGFLSTQAVPLLLDSELTSELLSRLITLYRPSFLWVPQKKSGAFSKYTPVQTLYDYTLLQTDCTDCPQLHPELSLLLTTSGSTGSPKLVRQSARNLLSNAEAIAQYLELNSTSERPILTLPLHYTFGLSILHSHLLTGGTVLLSEYSVIQQEFWDYFEREKATSISGVPMTYTLLERAGFFERELPSLRYFTQAGGKLPHRMHQRCAEFARERGLRFYAMYGQTEATARMSYLPWRLAEEKCGTIGIAIPGGVFRLVGDSGEEITEPYREGELVYEGPNVTLGYAQGPLDLARGDDFGGMLFTGDLAMRDTDGCYTVTGRKKRMVKLFGSRVSLDECERLLREQFGGADFACLGRDDHIDLFVTESLDCSAQKALTYLSETLRFPAWAFGAHPIAEIPRNEAGKIQYPRLEELL